MTTGDNTLCIFIDYDNLEQKHKAAGILDVVTKALILTPMEVAATRIKCDVRIYGGWYEGSQITIAAQSVSVEIQQAFPTMIRLPKAAGGFVLVSIYAELAFALLQEPGHHIFNTYRRKGKPNNVRVEEPVTVGCSDLLCVLPVMKKLLRTGNCPKAQCSVAIGDLIYRNEQKIVDTMLSCDLIYAAGAGHDKVILISGDDDFLPPLRTVLLQGAAAVRFHPKPNYQQASFPQRGAQLIENCL